MDDEDLYNYILLSRSEINFKSFEENLLRIKYRNWYHSEIRENNEFIIYKKYGILEKLIRLKIKKEEILLMNWSERVTYIYLFN